MSCILINLTKYSDDYGNASNENHSTIPSY
jgi:hypothetical protein